MDTFKHNFSWSAYRETTEGKICAFAMFAKQQRGRLRCNIITWGQYLCLGDIKLEVEIGLDFIIRDERSVGAIRVAIPSY